MNALQAAAAPTSNQRGTHIVPGRHAVSPFNFMPEVTAGFEIPTPLGLIDSTIRKVIYTVGVRPSPSELMAIGEILDELGIEEESLNVWFRSGGADPHEMQAARTIAGGGFKFKCNIFTDTMLGNGETPMPLMKQTIDMFAEMGFKLFNPGLLQPPTPDAHQRLVEQMHEMSDYIHAAGMEWNLTVANCARRDFGSLMALTNAAIDAGVRRLDLMDSTSALSPQAMGHFVRTYRAGMSKPTPMTMHTHDDFGMATAGTIAAVLAGASPDVALNGVSYRSGFAALEEVVLALDVLYGADTGIRLEKLQWASDRLADIMKFPVPPLKPVVGAHQFLREAPHDIVRISADQGETEFAAMGSSVAPGLTGSKYHWVWAAGGNGQVARTVARELNIELTDAQVEKVIALVEASIATLTSYPKWATPDEVRAIVRRVAAA